MSVPQTSPHVVLHPDRWLPAQLEVRAIARQLHDAVQDLPNISPFEHRKLWLLDGTHSLLAYAGSIRGHTTVAEAVTDKTRRS